MDRTKRWYGIATMVTWSYIPRLLFIGTLKSFHLHFKSWLLSRLKKLYKLYVEDLSNDCMYCKDVAQTFGKAKSAITFQEELKGSLQAVSHVASWPIWDFSSITFLQIRKRYSGSVDSKEGIKKFCIPLLLHFFFRGFVDCSPGLNILSDNLKIYGTLNHETKLILCHLRCRKFCSTFRSTICS